MERPSLIKLNQHYYYENSLFRPDSYRDRNPDHFNNIFPTFRTFVPIAIGTTQYLFYGYFS